jgi:hypothetical protein
MSLSLVFILISNYSFEKPCQRELYKVLDRLAEAQQKGGEEIYKFYLPNCNKNGFYHSKQVSSFASGLHTFPKPQCFMAENVWSQISSINSLFSLVLGG